MNPIPLRWCLAATGLAAVLGAWGGWTVRDWKRDSEVLAAARKAASDLDKARATVDRAASAYEQDRQNAATHTRERESTIREIYKDRPVRGDCAAPAAVVGVLGDAVAAANASVSGEPAPVLPAATRAAGPTD